MTARVDVLIPAYNAAGTIASSIESIQAQTVRDIRIIVVDDGSTDETGAILDAMAVADPRVHVIHTVNRGVVDALNTAFAAGDAKIIARHDADDIAFPDRFGVQLEWLDAHPECVAVSGNAWNIDAAGHRDGSRTAFEGRAIGDPLYAPSKEPYLMHPFLMARRDVVAAAGGYRHVFHAEDTDLYWRLARDGTLVNLPDLLGEYRLHAQSVSSRSVLNGRIAAVHAQLGALSERRRRAGRTDLHFPKDALARYHADATLDAIIERAARELDADERAHLEIATAAKLLELTTYRPYRLERADIATIRRAVARHYRRLTATNLRQLVFRQILHRGRLRERPREALALLPLAVVPAALLNLVRFAWGRAPGMRAAR